jgi:hypothetical protein
MGQNLQEIIFNETSNEFEIVDNPKIIQQEISIGEVELILFDMVRREKFYGDNVSDVEVGIGLIRNYHSLKQFVRVLDRGYPNKLSTSDYLILFFDRQMSCHFALWSFCKEVNFNLIIKNKLDEIRLDVYPLCPFANEKFIKRFLPLHPGQLSIYDGIFHGPQGNWPFYSEYALYPKIGAPCTFRVQENIVFGHENSHNSFYYGWKAQGFKRIPLGSIIGTFFQKYLDEESAPIGLSAKLSYKINEVEKCLDLSISSFSHSTRRGESQWYYEYSGKMDLSTLRVELSYTGLTDGY